MRHDDYVKAQLLEAAWLRGKEYGGVDATLLIMNVLGNRVRNGWGSWLFVLERIPAFSAVLEQPTGTPDLWEPAFVQLVHLVDGVFDGTSPDTAKGALYWADLRHIDNPWFKEKILSNATEHPRIGDMNTLTLFK